jgi:hypothetical protein
MADIERLRSLAQACVQAAHDIEHTDTAAMLLESAHRFLERASPDLAGQKADLREFNRRQIYAGLRH